MYTIELFPAHNDKSPVSRGAECFDTEEPIMVTEIHTTPIRGEVKERFVCNRGPGCTACNRSPSLVAKRLHAAAVRKAQADGLEAPAFVRPSELPLKSFKVYPPVCKDPTDEVLYVVLSYHDFGNSADWMVNTIHQLGWKGYTVIDLVVKCGTGDITDSHISLCAPYITYGIRETGAKRVVVCGTPASKAVTGNTMHPWNYGSWTHIPAPNRADGTPDPERVLVVSAPEPANALRNRFIAVFMRSALLRAMKSVIPASLPTDVVGQVVETRKDLAAFMAWAEQCPWLSYDVEWCGIPFDEGFRIVGLSFSHPDYREVWVFHDVLRLEEVKEALRKVLTTKPIVAQNVAAEFEATECFFGVELRYIEGDTMQAFKLMNVDSKAALEDLGYYIGYNSHKAEMKAAEKAKKELVEAKYPVDKGDASYMSFVMAEVDPEIMLRYNALDTFITGELHVEAERRLSKPSMAYLKRTYQTYTLPATKLLHRVHANGLLVDQRALAVTCKSLEQQVAELEGVLEGRYGIESPNAVAEIRDYLEQNSLFDKLLDSLARDHTGKKLDEKAFEMKVSKYKSRKTGVMSTGKLTLNAVKGWDGGDDGGIATVLKYREMSKLLSSYGSTLGSFIRADGRVHPRYRLDGAKTGRLSATAPNPQQIPKHGKNSTLIKSVFCAAFGYTLIAFDYKTLEVFIAAILSGDEAMQAACMGTDFHLETAKKMAPFAWKCTALDVEAEVAAGNKSKRTAAKGITFSILYGAGAYAIADTLRCSIDQAEDLIKAYYAAYPKFAKWVTAQHSFARDNGFVYVPWVGEPARLRPLTHAGYTAKDDKARFKQAMRQAVNTPVQGCAAQFAVVAANDLEEQFRSEQMLAKVVAMVHDSIIVECHESLIHDVVVRMYHAMTGIPTGAPLRLQVDADIGPTWGSMEPLDLEPYVGAKS